jgi:hypothetical protein
MREKSLVTMRSEKPLNFGDVSKGMFNDAICEFESCLNRPFLDRKNLPDLPATYRNAGESLSRIFLDFR